MQTFLCKWRLLAQPANHKVRPDHPGKKCTKGPLVKNVFVFTEAALESPQRLSVDEPRNQETKTKLYPREFFVGICLELPKQ